RSWRGGGFPGWGLGSLGGLDPGWFGLLRHRFYVEGDLRDGREANAGTLLLIDLVRHGEESPDKIPRAAGREQSGGLCHVGLRPFDSARQFGGSSSFCI